MKEDVIRKHKITLKNLPALTLDWCLSPESHFLVESERKSSKEPPENTGTVVILIKRGVSSGVSF